MAGQGVRSERKAMTQAVEGFDTAAAAVKKAATDLEQELAQDTKRYHGEQAAAFREVHLMLQDDLKTTTSTLDTMSTSVHESLTGYTNKDRDTGQRINQLRKKYGNVGSGGPAGAGGGSYDSGDILKIMNGL